VVAARSVRALPVEVLPRRRPWIGRPHSYDVTVVAESLDERAAPRAVSGQLTRAPWLAVGVPPLLLVVGLLAAGPPPLLTCQPASERVWLEPARPVADQPVTVRWQARGGRRGAPCGWAQPPRPWVSPPAVRCGLRTAPGASVAAAAAGAHRDGIEDARIRRALDVEDARGALLQPAQAVVD
jgi:hypothetical protein